MAARLKANIYSVGGSIDPEDAYKAFRGKLPSPDAMLRKKGLSTFEELSGADA
jgi:peptidyl-dipeptidase Dcp